MSNSGQLGLQLTPRGPPRPPGAPKHPARPGSRGKSSRGAEPGELGLELRGAGAGLGRPDLGVRAAGAPQGTRCPYPGPIASRQRSGPRSRARPAGRAARRRQGPGGVVRTDVTGGDSPWRAARGLFPSLARGRAGSGVPRRASGGRGSGGEGMGDRTGEGERDRQRLGGR